MEGAGSASGEAAIYGAANEGGGTVKAPANEQRDPGGDEELGAAESSNESAPLEGSSEEEKGSRGSANEQAAAGGLANEDGGGRQGSANEEAEPRGITDEAKGLQQPTNEAAEREAPTNERAPAQATTNNNGTAQDPTNEDAAAGATANGDDTLQTPANQSAEPSHPTKAGSAHPETPNEGPPHRAAPPNQDTPCGDPSNGASPHGAEPPNELVALPAPANGTRDPWDWSLEEAWLRSPEGEGPEEWGEGQEDWGEGPDEDEDEEGAGEEGPEGWWLSPDASLSKLIRCHGRGLARPGLGSHCRVFLSVPSRVPAGWGPPSPASGAGRWVTVQLGTGEGRWAWALDAALETMARGERAWLRPAGAGGAALGVHLGAFTPAPAFWESPPAARWRAVAAGQARAAALLAGGAVGPAARAYGRALRAAVAAGGAPPLSPEAAQAKAELHAGLALCQLHLGLPAAAAANAGKALALRPAHLEARYRRAVAAAAMMDLEAAMADLAAVLRAQPGHVGARRELRRVRGAARERDARLARRLGRLFA